MEKKRCMERLECLYMLNELKPIIGKRFRKAYMLSNGEIKISFEKINIIATVGKRLNVLTVERNDYVQHWFTSKLRSELKNEKVKDVYLLDNDRVFVFEFNNHLLVFPVFGKHNLVLYKKNEEKNEIIASLSKEEIRTENHELKSLMEKYKEKPIGAVMVRYLGKAYSNFFLTALGIDEKTITSTLLDKATFIEEKINEIVKSLKPYLKKSNENAADFSLIKKEGYEEVASLSFAMDIYYKEEKTDEKITKAIKIQEEALKEYEEKSNLYKKIGDFIFNHVEEIEKIIKIVNQEKKENLDELLKIVNEKLEKDNVKIKVLSINPGGKSIEIEVFL